MLFIDLGYEMQGRGAMNFAQKLFVTEYLKNAPKSVMVLGLPRQIDLYRNRWSPPASSYIIFLNTKTIIMGKTTIYPHSCNRCAPQNWLFTFALLLLSFSAAMANTYTVSNTDDDGAGSLREAINQANANPGADIIDFSVAGTVSLLSTLPAITDALTIDGSTAPGYASGAPTFLLDGELTVFLVDNPTALTIKGLDLSSSGAQAGTGFQMYAATGSVQVFDCVVNNRQIAIFCQGNANWTISGNDLSLSDTNLNFTDITSGNIIAADNKFGGFGTGLALYNCSNKVIGDENAAPAADILIRDNDGLTMVGSNAVYVSNCSNLTIDNIDASNNNFSTAGSGIVLLNASGDMRVTDCTVNSRQGGLVCHGNANWTVSNNNLFFTERSLSFTDVTTGTISAFDNIFGGGIGLTLNNCSNKVIGNELAAPAADILIKDMDGLTNSDDGAISVNNCSDLTFDHLDLSYTTGPAFGVGIGISFSSGEMIIRHCKAQNRQYGFVLDGNNHLTATNNDLTTSLTAMFVVRATAGSIGLSDNLMGGAGASDGVFLYLCSGLVVGDENASSAADILIKDGDGLTSIGNLAMYAADCTDMTFDNLDLHNATGQGQGFGFYGQNASGAFVVKNCNLSNRSIGLLLDGNTTNSQFTCNIITHCQTGIGISGTHTNASIAYNVLESNNNSIEQSGSALVAQSNYWGGGAPVSGGYNGYTGTVNVSSFLTSPAECTPYSCPDSDGDGICNAEDNCPATANASQADADHDGVGDVCDGCPNDANKSEPGQCGCGNEDTDSDGDGTADCNETGCQGPDSDCDGVANACDVCPTGNDAIDNNNDGIADCSQLLPYASYSAAWKCGANKIQVCHNGNTLCINKNALAAHFNHGDKVGPCTGCGSKPAAERAEETALSEAGYEALAMSVQPNPTSDEVLVQLLGLQAAGELKISDQLGKTVLRMEVTMDQTALTIDLSGGKFVSGVYVVTLTSDKQQLAQRLVICK